MNWYTTMYKIPQKSLRELMNWKSWSLSDDEFRDAGLYADEVSVYRANGEYVGFRSNFSNCSSTYDPLTDEIVYGSFIIEDSPHHGEVLHKTYFTVDLQE